MSRVVSDIYWKAMAGLTVWNMFAGSTEPVWSSEILTKCAPVAWLRIRIHDMLLNLFVISSSIWKKKYFEYLPSDKFQIWCYQSFKNLVWLDIVLRFSNNPWNVCKVQVCTWKTPRIRSLICFNPRDLRTHHKGRQLSRTEGVTTPNPKPR